MLAYVTGTVDQELMARNEYLAAENRIMKAQLKGRLKLSDAERSVLGEIGHRLGRKILADVATVARPDTILGWYRKLVARKFDGLARRGPGRPRISREVEQLILRMASENRSWGYDRIAGALANLGHEVSDQTVGNVLRRHGLPPAPERKRTTTWADFIRTHLALLAGTDFFTAEVLTLRGLVTYYVLFFIHLGSRRVAIAGVTVNPLIDIMDEIDPDMDAATLVTNDAGEPYTEDGMRTMINKLCRELADEGKVNRGLNIHGLRHSLGSELYDLGLEREARKAVMAHESDAASRIYERGGNRSIHADRAVRALNRKHKRLQN
jgi:integrase